MSQNDDDGLKGLGISFLVITIIMVVMPALIFGLPI